LKDTEEGNGIVVNVVKTYIVMGYMRMSISKESFLKYEELRLSGATNMFAVNIVMKATGLTKEEVIDIMKNYTKYCDMYLHSL